MYCGTSTIQWSYDILFRLIYLRTMFKHFLKWLGITNKYEVQNAKKKLSMIYAIVGWNSFALVFYLILKKEIPSDPTERRLAYKEMTGTPNTDTHVFEISGLTVSKDFHLTYDVSEKNKEPATIDENL